MMNHYFTSELASAHRQDLMSEAESARMAKQARMARPNLGSRMLDSLQACFAALHRRVAVQVGSAEAANSTAQVVLSSDR